LRSQAKSVPYFSQLESRELTSEVLARGRSALAEDPQWAMSGAETLDEYVRWAGDLCGMACLKMILAARTQRVFPTLSLARMCTRYGGYKIDDAGRIKGLIYAPFVEFVRQEFAIEAEVVTHVGAHEIDSILQANEFFIASVHHSIRWPEREPPAKGGHLVLVLHASTNAIVFHNPSGHTQSSQEYASLPCSAFGRYFAGRGIAIKPQPTASTFRITTR
jgi:hypothetical protein